MFKLDLEKAKEPEIKLPTSNGSLTNQEMGIQNNLTCLLRYLYTGEEATGRALRGTMDWFKIVKGVHQGYIFSACLFKLMQSKLCEMLGRIKCKLESRLPRDTSITSDMQMTLHLWQKAKRN